MLKKIVKSIIGILVLCSFCYCSNNQKDKPNILWVIAEDLSPDLNCYGNKLVRTPILDQLAEKGVKFTNLITVASVCAPSRTE